MCDLRRKEHVDTEMSAHMGSQSTLPSGESDQSPNLSDLCIDGRWLSLLFFSPAHWDDIWAVCIKSTQANLRLFYRIYKTRSANASEFLALISKPPPGSIDALVYTFVDRSNGRVLGFTVLYDCGNENERLSAIFMPLHGVPGPFERSIDAFQVLWEYAIETLGCNRVHTRCVHDTEYGIPDLRTFFGFVGMVKRSLTTEKTKDFNTYTITKEHWPIISEAGGAWLYGRGLPASSVAIPGL
jgi:hypothetical protein